MLHRLIDGIRNIGGASRAETYYASLQWEARSRGIRIDEARRDYQPVEEYAAKIVVL